MMQFWANIHIPHDYKPDGNVYLHVHWFTTGTTAGQVCRWGFEFITVKGYGQSTASVIGATTTVYVEQTATATALQHLIAETSVISLTNIEPDAVILCRVFRDAAHANDTLSSVAYVLKFDGHIEVDRIATKNRNITDTGSFYV